VSKAVFLEKFWGLFFN